MEQQTSSKLGMKYIKAVYCHPAYLTYIQSTSWGMQDWMKAKYESEKASLKRSIQKPKIMASNPITSWQIDGETMETVTNFIFLGSKITAYGDCSHEIKTLAPWKKSYVQPK